MSAIPGAAGTPRTLRRLIVGLICAALTMVGLTVVITTRAAAPATAAAGDYSCGSTLLYGTGSAGTTGGRTLYSVDITSGATTSVGTFTSAPSNSSVNALAVTKDGSAAYAVVDYSNINTVPMTAVSSSTTLHRFDISSGTSTQVATITGLNVNGLKAGGIDPTTNTYWFGGNGTGAYANYFLIYSYNLTTLTNNGIAFKIPVSTQLNADLAFDAKGNLYVALSDGTSSNNKLLEFDASQINAGGASVSGTKLATLSPYDGTAASMFPAMAFGADGYLYTSAGGVLYKTNPSNGSVISSINTNPPVTFGDLGSCSTPNTLTVQTNIASRVSSGDQFTSKINATNGLSSAQTGTTTGTALGLHTAAAEVAGPVLVFQKKTYTFSVAKTDGTMTGYTAAYTCLDGSGNTVASAASNSGSVTIPVAAGTGIDVTCTVTVRVGAPHLNLTMTSTSAPTSAGDTITYTYVITSNGNEALSGVAILDPLISSTAFTCGAGSLNIDATATCTKTHTVTQAEVDAGTVANTATASGAGWLSQVGTTDTATVTTTITAAPKLSVSLASSGTPWLAGDTVTWTATVKNTGNVTIHAIASSDTLGGGWTCATTTLAPGASTTCTSTHALTAAEIAAGTLSDTVTSTAKDPSNTAISGSSTVTIGVTKNATFTVTKKVTGNGASKTTASTFTVSYTWTGSGHSGSGSFTLTAGKTWTSPNLPDGATVNLSEATPVKVPDVDWQTPAFSVNGFSLTTSNQIAVILTNTATLDYQLVPQQPGGPTDCSACMYY